MLSFREFQATRTKCADLDSALRADLGGDGPSSGFLYADGTCFIQDVIDAGKPTYLLVIERLNWLTDDLEELEKILWAAHYLSQEGEFGAMLTSDMLDTYVQGICAAHEIEVDGDLWGNVFSDVPLDGEISVREAHDRMISNL